MEPRLSVNNDFWNSNWVWYAKARTGINLSPYYGNCFGYATARISEIVGEYTSLDGDYRVNAGDLWDNHNSCFKKSDTPVPGALLIMGGNAILDNDGLYHDYGHVAVVELVNDDGTITWSQSNYGGNPFEVITGNPNTIYAPMYVKGYLIHENLEDVQSYGLEDDELMKFTFEIKHVKDDSVEGIYYFDGKDVKNIHHPDELEILKQIYKDTCGRELKHYQWQDNAPWYIRFLDVVKREANTSF